MEKYLFYLTLIEELIANWPKKDGKFVDDPEKNAKLKNFYIKLKKYEK